MITDLRELIAKRPFVPFTIHTVDGGGIRVPNVDHIAVPPAGDRVFVSSTKASTIRYGR